MAVACVAAAVLSAAVHGFHFGVNNSLFHVPIVMGWWHEPAFAEDHFIQSLRNFTSIDWRVGWT